MNPQDQKIRILLLDTKASNPNHYICLEIERALAQHPAVESVHRADYSNAISIAVENNTNFFLAFDGEAPDWNICTRLAEICQRSAVWFTEDPYEINVNTQFAKIFDLVFTNDKSSVKRYGEKGKHLPLAASEYFHFHPIPNEDDYLYDLLFVGTAWPNRVLFLKQLLPLLSNIKYKFALPTNPHLPKFDLPLDEFEYSWKTSNLDFARLANKSRITLSLHRDFSLNSENSFASTPGPRLFEVALAGSLQLIPSDLQETSEYYNTTSEVITFNDVFDAAEKIKYFLKQQDERRAAASKAQQHTIKNHLYENRIEEIIANVSKLKTTSQDSSLSVTGKKNILFVSHNTVSSKIFGGVEVYQDLITKELSSEFNFFHFTAKKIGDTGFSKFTVLMDGDYRELELFKYRDENHLNTFRSEQRELAFKNILLKYKIDLVHFQHLIGHPLSLPLITQQLGIPSALTVHDYFLACENYNLIDYSGRFCNATRSSLHQCDACLIKTVKKAPGYQAERRMFVNTILNSVDRLIFNTDGVKELFFSYFIPGKLRGKSIVLPPPIASRTTLPGKTREITLPLKVACLGNFIYKKGSEVQMVLFELCRNLPVEFYILGSADPETVDRIKESNFKNVHFSGRFTQDELSEKLSKMHLSMHFSIWPETYCLTLSEAWQNGLIPIVSNIGALSERVIHEKNGFKFEIDDFEGIVRKITDLTTNPTQIYELRKNITDELWENDHTKILKQVYSELAPGHLATFSHSSSYQAKEVGTLNIVLEKINSIKNRNTPIETSLMLSRMILDFNFRLYNYLKKHGFIKTFKKIYRKLSHA